jgi:hypothetical protein
MDFYFMTRAYGMRKNHCKTTKKGRPKNAQNPSKIPQKYLNIYRTTENWADERMVENRIKSSIIASKAVKNPYKIPCF